MEEWIEIFRTGTHASSSGVKRIWTEADLDKIVSNYNNNLHSNFHEAPVVIGHPTDNAPAWGWVESLKREGGRLFAKLKDLVPEFVEAVKKGMYKKRSMSLYPDLSLRHVGFLGGVPPAVKGLADIKFRDGSTAIEFYNWGEDMSDTSLLETIKEKLNEIGGSIKGKGYEEELRLAKEQVTAQARELQKMKADAEKAKSRTFCDKLKKEGRLIPAWEEAGIVEFMAALDAGEVIEFSEDQKTTPLGWFTSFLESLPRIVDFSESARRDKAVQPQEKKEHLINEYSEKNKVSYSSAAVEISKAHPELFDF